MTSGLGNMDRRRFAGVMGLWGAGAIGAAVAPTTIFADDAPATHDHASSTGGSTTTTTSAKTDELTADEMDAMHEEGIKSFPAATEGLGGQPLEFVMEGDIKVFNLTVDAVEWEYQPGKYASAFGYNGVVPGPEIRVTEGDKIRVNVTNNMIESTAVHWHGCMVPNNQDGVPFITQPPIKPGQTFTYEFPIRAGNAGTHMYHAHHNSAEQVSKGLLGPFIIEPADPSTRPQFDIEYTMVLNDGPIGGYSINGKSFPATTPLTAKLGQRVMVRMLNEGQMIHPMHLHGMPMQVVAEDGFILSNPYMRDTVQVDPGGRVEVIIEATELGVWAFHCHILSHAESRHGMFGMVTVMIVEE